MSNKSADPRRAARSAGLVYVSDEQPGIHRQASGKKFVYISASGKRIHDARTLQRIAHLAIPPAYHDVWICPKPNGHIQAVGRDERGRKQYRYHEDWRVVRDQVKYGHIADFGKALPAIRRTAARHLRLPGLTKEKVLAAVIRFMEVTLIRVGNDEYAKNNHSYGLTTLQDRHARISRGKVHLEFRGKSGVRHAFDIENPRLARIAKRCQDLPGQELFQYLDEHGKVCDVSSTDVNDYLRQISGKDFTAKDFRTWAGTVLAMAALAEMKPFESITEAKRNIVQAIAVVADKLGNTRAVCRKCYIHPEVIAAYLDNDLLAMTTTKRRGGLRTEEKALLALLRKRTRQS